MYPPISIKGPFGNAKWLVFAFGLIFAIMFIWLGKFLWSEPGGKLGSLFFYVLSFLFILLAVCFAILPERVN